MSDPASREQAVGEDPRGREGLPGRGEGPSAVGRWLLAAWVGVILAAVLPWTGFRPHSHWGEIIWIPFSTPPELTAVDLVANVLLYVPFGYLYGRLHGRRVRVFLRGVFWAVLVSILTELTQVYSHGRFPSTTDVVLNVLGASLGLYLAVRKAHAVRSEA